MQCLMFSSWRVGFERRLRNGDDRCQASDHDDQDLIRHLFCCAGLFAAAPLHCGTKDRPADDQCRGLHYPQACRILRWNLVQPVQEDLIEFLLQRDLEERLELLVWWLHVATKGGKEVENGQNERAQGVHLQSGCGRKLALHCAVELRAHPAF